MLILIPIFSVAQKSKSIDCNQLQSVEDKNTKHSYKITTIGNQVWMAENLKKKYSFYKREDKLHYSGVYGDFFSFDNALKACPEGWRLPTKEDWEQLIDLAGGIDVAAKELKSKGTSASDGYWRDYKDFEGKDTYCFAVQPAGFYEVISGSMLNTGEYSYFLTSTKVPGTNKLYVVTFNYFSDKVKFNEYPLEDKYYFVRCIKNN